MRNESGLFNQTKETKTTEPTPEHHGSINLAKAEKDELEKESAEKFDKHPAFEGVEIRPLDIETVPADIKEKIDSLGGIITAFTIVKIIESVPNHQHKEDNEMYFGGEDAIVTILDADQNEIGQYALSSNSFNLALNGESHGVISHGENGSTFYGVKFVIKTE